MITRGDIEAALEAGTQFRCGLPTVIRRDGEIHVLDLVAARRGAPDPWHSALTPAPGVVVLEHAADRTIYVGGMAVGGEDVGAALSALRMAPPSRRRHAAGANRARREAGLAATKVRDSMVRARLLDAVDGWAALEAGGEVLDDDPAEGRLIRPAEELGLTVLLLVVVCPSTGRRYCHRVPRKMSSAYQARGWMMGMGEGDPRPDVES